MHIAQHLVPGTTALRMYLLRSIRILLIVRNNKTKKKKCGRTWTKIKEANPVKLRNKLSTNGTLRQYMEKGRLFGRKPSPTHTSASLYSAGIRGYEHRCIPGEIDALAEAHINVAEDGLTLHVAFPSLYEHVGNRNRGLRTINTIVILLLLLVTAAATTATTNSN